MFKARCHVADWCNRLAEVWPWPPLSSSFTEALTTITLGNFPSNMQLNQHIPVPHITDKRWLIPGSCSRSSRFEMEMAYFLLVWGEYCNSVLKYVMIPSFPLNFEFILHNCCLICYKIISAVARVNVTYKPNRKTSHPHFVYSWWNWFLRECGVFQGHIVIYKIQLLIIWTSVQDKVAVCLTTMPCKHI
jgi:hypothetical protein